MATNVMKILRSLTAGRRPIGRVYGEPYVNFADGQFGVMNNSNVAQDLIGVPIFSTGAIYTAGQTVYHSGLLYTAVVNNGPGAWNAAQWDLTALAGPTFLSGGILSNDGTAPNTSIDITPVACADSSGQILIQTSSTLVKNLSAGWTAGNNGGALGPGVSWSVSIWYHIFAAIINGAGDIFADSDPAASHKPSGTTAFRRIGSVVTAAGPAVTPFTQFGDNFWYHNFYQDYASGSVGSSAGTNWNQSLFHIPSGIVTEVMIKTSLIIGTATAGQYVAVVHQPTFMPTQASTGYSDIFITQPNNEGAGSFRVLTNTSQQINIGYFATVSQSFIYIDVIGYVDARGK